MNAPRIKASDILQKAKNEIKITNLQKNFGYISTDSFNSMTYTLIKQYIENVSKECELAKILDVFDFHNSKIPSQ